MSYKVILTFSFIFFVNTLSAQVNWSNDIAPIIYDKCVECHRPNGIGPFDFTSYENAYDFRYSIQGAISSGEMPPWLPNKDYRHFADEFFLTDEEEQQIMDWVNTGAASGDLSQAPPLPPLPSGASLLESIDYVVAIEPYTLQSNQDEYRWFVIETDFSETVYVNKIEVFPGLKNVVHHADISYDVTDLSLNNDLLDPLPGFNNSTGGPNYSFYMNAWQPGANIAEYPDGWGIAVPPGADFVIEIHYGPGGIGQIDSTIMNLEFVPAAEVEKAVKVGWLLSDSGPTLLDGPLYIPANQTKTFHQQSAPLSQPMSLISICPHMHYLGKSYKVWAETPDGSTIPLIDIPQWDFNWQRYYSFPYVEYLPSGTTLHSEGVYDNTVNNPHNPSNPPVDVSKGTKTTDEMFLCYFIYANYEPGDENVFLGDTIPDDYGVGIFNPILEIQELNLFPNPSTDVIYADIKNIGKGRLQILNIEGKVIHSSEVRNVSDKLNEGIFIAHLDNGIYFLRVESDAREYSGVFVKK